MDEDECKKFLMNKRFTPGLADKVFRAMLDWYEGHQ